MYSCNKYTGGRMDRQDDFNKNHSIQSNDLIRAAYSVTLGEKKLLLKAISKIDSFNPIPKDGCIVVDIKVSECIGLFNKGNIWREMSKAASLLQSRTVTLFPTSDTREEISWVDTSTYYEKKSLIRIKFGHTVSKKLTGIIEKYTQVELLDVGQLKSVHSVRLLELLKQVETSQKQGWLKISVEEFRVVMGLDGKYPTFGPLYTRVIEPALTELNKNSNWNITLEKVKKGKAIHMLLFTFTKKLQKVFDLKETKKSTAENSVKQNLTKQQSRKNITAAIMDIHDTSW